MGTMMRFPIKDQIDWEDVKFTDEMVEAVLGYRTRKQMRRFMTKYIKERGCPLWGVKSPFLLPFVEEFKDLAGDEVKVVHTTRDVEETYKSIQVQTDQKPEGLQKHVRRIQDLLVPSLDHVKPDLVIPIEESWKSPDIVKGKLKALIRS
jgi:hypothetical protein